MRLFKRRARIENCTFIGRRKTNLLQINATDPSIPLEIRNCTFIEVGTVKVGDYTTLLAPKGEQ